MQTAPAVRWYFKSYVLVIGFLCIGPFILPLVWFNPHLSMRHKAAVTVAIVIITYLIWIVSARSLGSLNEYYQLLSRELK